MIYILIIDRMKLFRLLNIRKSIMQSVIHCVSQPSRHSTFQKHVESSPCAQGLPACLELRRTARASHQLGRREQGVAGLLGVGQVLLSCSRGEAEEQSSPGAAWSRACVRTCARAHVRACVRACASVRAHVRTCTCMPHARTRDARTRSCAHARTRACPHAHMRAHARASSEGL